MDQGGSDTGPLVVLLHGLGHTGEVWRPLAGALAPAVSWVIVDLPGHGRSPWTGQYSVTAVTAAVARQLPRRRPAVVVGHSFGGVVALALAATNIAPAAVLGFGIKVAWTDDELAATRNRAGRSPRVFRTEDEARAAFVRFAGLEGVVDPGSELAGSGVTAVVGGFRLAADPRTMAVDAPDLAALLSGAAASTVVLARGEHDQLVSGEQLLAVDPGAVTLPGVGHNAHVTHPDAVAGLVAELAAADTG